MRAALLGGALLAAAALGGCGGVESLSIPAPGAPPTSVASDAVTLPSNLSSVSESAVAGPTTTTTVAVGPGSATISGTVLGPSGPIAGATVEADRFVGDQVASVQTISTTGGTFTFNSVLGGRYRLRAWRVPSLAMTTPYIFFLGATQHLTVTLQPQSFPADSVTMSISPAQPIVDEMANMAVLVTNPVVEANGNVQNTPVAGVSVTLTGGANWDVYNGNPLTTSSAGLAIFQVSCQVAGVDPLSAAVGSGQPQALAVPACQAPPPPTTTTTTGVTPTFPCPSTSLPSPFATTTSLPFGSCG